MAVYQGYRPKNGLRQPRIFYSVDDPRMAVLEELRRSCRDMGSMNALYLEALVIGAGVLLARSRSEGGAPDEIPAGVASPGAGEVSAASPAPVAQQQSPSPQPPPSPDASVQAPASGSPPLGDNQRIRATVGSRAARLALDQFG